jgi:agmatine/peptidylarginine deiminase
MKNILITILSLIIITNVIIYSQDLPRYMTEEEKVLMKTYIPPVFESGFFSPPAKPVRTMAEWEELEGIIITWTSYQSILRQIVDYAQEEGIVYIVCSDSNSVKSYLTSGNVPLYNLKFIIANFNSVWVRDYGPWCVYSDIADSMYIIDWIYNRPRPLDDLIPSVFATRQNIPLYQMTQPPYDFVATGGNFMTDGISKGFSSKLILTENPGKTESQIDTMMKQFMGITPYIKMDVLPYDGIHHIDMHMKLLDEETLLVGQYPPGISDGPQIEANLQYVLNNFQSAYGRPFRVVRILMPPDAQGRYPSSGGDYRTYTNSVIVNKTVIVPTYAPQYDTTALRIYREAMPGYNIVGINSNQMITALGAIHCITKEIGVREPVFIAHPKILSTANSLGNYEVKAFIKTRTGVSNAYLHWSVDTAQGFNSVLMNQISPDTFRAYIPQQSVGTKVFYYISANSNSGRTVKKPLTSPAGAYSFIVDSFIPVELISFTAERNNSEIILKWTTGSEFNNKGFEIQKRNIESVEVKGNSQVNISDWETIGFVNGKGSSTNIVEYIFVDKSLVSGKYAYRLKQIDFDGHEKFSHIVEVDYHSLNEFVIYQNYPNPYNPVTTIKYSIPTSSQPHLLNKERSWGEVVSLKVYDVLGNEVATLVNTVQPAGNYQVEFDGSALSSGVYLYKLQVGDFVQTKKMLLMK